MMTCGSEMIRQRVERRLARGIGSKQREHEHRAEDHPLVTDRQFDDAFDHGRYSRCPACGSMAGVRVHAGACAFSCPACGSWQGPAACLAASSARRGCARQRRRSRAAGSPNRAGTRPRRRSARLPRDRSGLRRDPPTARRASRRAARIDRRWRRTRAAARPVSTTASRGTVITGCPGRFERRRAVEARPERAAGIGRREADPQRARAVGQRRIEEIDACRETADGLTPGSRGARSCRRECLGCSPPAPPRAPRRATGPQSSAASSTDRPTCRR